MPDLQSNTQRVIKGMAKKATINIRRRYWIKVLFRFIGSHLCLNPYSSNMGAKLTSNQDQDMPGYNLSIIAGTPIITTRLIGIISVPMPGIISIIMPVGIGWCIIWIGNPNRCAVKPTTVVYPDGTPAEED